MAALTTIPTSIPSLISRTNSFLNDTTIYLSTLSAPVEPLEELLAILGLTSSLLGALQSTISKSDLVFHPEKSFLNPLTRDIGFNIEQLHSIINTARTSRVWESSNSGVVNGGRDTWCIVCGGEENARRLRSRFFVEKYRVRVLIDAVNWFALSNIGVEARTLEQENEYQEVGRRLGTVAERLVGVWRDYTPRLKALAGEEMRVGGKREGLEVDLDEMEVKRQKMVQLRMMDQARMQGGGTAPPRYEAMPSTGMKSRHFQARSPALANDEKRALSQDQTDNCASCSKATTPFPRDEKYETYLLRQNPSTTHLKTSTHILGLLLSTTHSHTPSTHYIKPLPSSISEISSFRQISLSTFSSGSLSNPNEEIHLLNLRKRILKLPETAQWEIQKLVEKREAATSGKFVKREWEVCAFVERERRKITHQSIRKKWFWQRSGRVEKKGGKNKMDKRDQVEYVLVVRGRTVDFEERGGFGGISGSGGNGREEIKLMQQRQLAAMRTNQANVLRERERVQKRVLSGEEADIKMREMCRDIFRLQENDGEAEESGDDCCVDEEESEDEDMDVKD